MKVVAVIGASRDRRKFGNKAVRAFHQQGFTVVPINPHEAEIEGLKAYPSVLDVPGSIDMATLYVPSATGERVMDEVARKGIVEVWLNPGADGPSVLARAQAVGLRPIQACSILGLGVSPSAYYHDASRVDSLGSGPYTDFLHSESLLRSASLD